MQSGRLNYDKLPGYIYYGDGIQAANVMTLESKGNADPDKIAAFEVLAGLLTNEIRDGNFRIAQGQSYQNAWIRRPRS